MNTPRNVYVVGGAHSAFVGPGSPDFVGKKHPDFGKRQNPTLEDHLRQALSATFEVTGVAPEAVDRGFVSNFLAECFLRQGHLGSLVAGLHPGLDGKPWTRIEAACASGAAAIASAFDALQASADVVLVAGVEVETNVPTRDGIDYMARAGHYERQHALDGFLFPHLFARRARAYKERFGATGRDLAHVVAKAYGNAARNPKAQMRAVPMSVDAAADASAWNHEFLTDAELRPHIKIADCTTFTDGASAAVLVNDAGLRRLGLDVARCTRIAGIGHATAPLGGESDPTRLATVARAAERAYAAAGARPSDVQLAEVHDCFSVAELQMLEALGLCGPGEAARLTREGVTARDGRLPVNPGGGLLGFGHPIGATGVKQVVEVWRQMKGLATEYPIAHAARVAVTANLGGDDRTGIVMVHRDAA